MSEPRSKVEIDDLKDKFLECPVCVEHFNLSDRRPRLLQSCLHAFCTQCLQELLNKERRGRITCPLCRKVEKVPGKAEALPADPVRSNLVEYLQVTQQKGIQCTDCPDGFEATFRCQPCRMYLCNECKAAHRRTRSTRDHRVISLEEMLDDTTDNLERLHFCEIHPNQKLEFYCTTDDKLCCVSCTVVDHSGHKFQKIEETALAKKQELDNNLERLQGIGKNIENRKGENEIFITTLKTEIDKSESDVNAMCDDLKNSVEERRAELLKQVREKNTEPLMLLQKQIEADKDTLARVDSTVLYCKQTKTRTDDVELCLMHDSISRNIGSISDDADSPEQKQPILGFMFVPDNSAKLKNLISSLGECKPKCRKLPDGLAREVKIVLIGENGPHKILVGNVLLRRQSFSLERLTQASGSVLKERSEIDGHNVTVDTWDYASGTSGPYGNRRNVGYDYGGVRACYGSGADYLLQHEVITLYDVHLLVIPTTADPPKDNYQSFFTAIQNIQQQLNTPSMPIQENACSQIYTPPMPIQQNMWHQLNTLRMPIQQNTGSQLNTPRMAFQPNTLSQLNTPRMSFQPNTGKLNPPRMPFQPNTRSQLYTPARMPFQPNTGSQLNTSRMPFQPNMGSQLNKTMIVFVTDVLTTSLVQSCNIEDYIGYSEQLQSLLEQVGGRYVVLDSGASANSQRDFLYDVTEKVKMSPAEQFNVDDVVSCVSFLEEDDIWG